MSIEAMKQALEALEETESALARCIGPHKAEEGDRHRALAKSRAAITALRLAIEQAERQEPGPLVNIELSRRMAAVKVSNFYGSIIKDAEKEIQRLHGLVLQHTAPRQPLTEAQRQQRDGINSPNRGSLGGAHD